MEESNNFKKYLENLISREVLFNTNNFINTLNSINSLLVSENDDIRPRDNDNSPGGLIYLKKEIDTFIIPDIHGRYSMLLKLLEYKVNSVTVLDLLFNNKVQIICVGDGFHSEARGRDRWKRINIEFLNNFNEHNNIDEEMFENFAVMRLVIELKLKFPNNFHFLKGNHENILNENSEGNYSFGKFTTEGDIVKSWVLKFMGEVFIYKYSNFEKLLPLFAVGDNYIVSHSEPSRFFTIEELINCYDNYEVIYGLTWTRNSNNKRSTISEYFNLFFNNSNYENLSYIVGHDSIKDKYITDSECSRLIKIHNPHREGFMHIKPGIEIVPNEDIGEFNA